ncbi:hypothetical protein MKX50_22670 [Paenibacillus sp. FSL W8-0186]|uniref:Uncharacterized protein n=1 Tax=Paenibacillus woosongensis TaxID=307580 RepID=A0ABQ4MWC6_9BACL|nr:hypothetical protein [Paenibacillus woosongensis]GIP60234.1 hypothetical protein J15TS10_40480 [Paenibacillus woosongensis]
MKTKVIILVLLVLMLISGCGQAAKLEPDAFLDKDMCIESIHEPGTNICFGMSRKKVENILGSGKGNDIEQRYGAATIYYRDDKVVGIELTKGDWFQTPRGIHVGSTKEEAEKQYGSRYMHPVTPNGLLYSFYQFNKNPLGIQAIKKEKSDEEMEGIYEIWILADTQDVVNNIMLLDERLSVEMWYW